MAQVTGFKWVCVWVTLIEVTCKGEQYWVQWTGRLSLFQCNNSEQRPFERMYAQGAKALNLLPWKSDKRTHEETGTESLELTIKQHRFWKNTVEGFGKKQDEQMPSESMIILVSGALGQDLIWNFKKIKEMWHYLSNCNEFKYRNTHSLRIYLYDFYM